MTDIEFARLKAIVEKELIINEDNLSDKSLKIPNLHQKYLDIYTKEMRILKDLSLKKTKKYSDLYHKNKFEGEYKLDYAKEIETYVNGDPDYYKNCQEFNYQDIIVKFLESTLENIQKMNFTIKNYIEWRKFLAGG
jgi:hypothetical protein